jgi:hypothetical protein
MRWTPTIVLMDEDLVAALEDDVADLETRLSADTELDELWQRNGWDPRMMAYGLIYKRYAEVER